MATTTPNFGWAVPTSTDLVKDGAVAIETLGDAIDASLVDLKGGTTGQVLKKNTNTDMDFVWSSDSAGMTNPMTTTGDTIYSSSGSTPARLGIGTTGQVLTVASGVPSWATPSAGSSTFVGCKLTGVDQNISTGTATTLLWNGEDFDTDGFHSTSTNTGRITIPTGKAGKYQFSALVDFDNNATGQRQMIFRKNGTTNEFANIITASAQYPSGEMNGILNLAEGDYVELQVLQTSGSTQLFYLAKPNGNFSCTYLGA
jgi:hypothetical protein